MQWQIIAVWESTNKAWASLHEDRGLYISKIYSAARQLTYLGRRNDIKKGKAIRVGELLVTVY